MQSVEYKYKTRNCDQRDRAKAFLNKDFSKRSKILKAFYCKNEYRGIKNRSYARVSLI